MFNENHMKKAGEKFRQGAKESSREFSEGDLLQAVKEAAEGAVGSVAELGKSAVERAQSAVNPDR